MKQYFKCNEKYWLKTGVILYDTKKFSRRKIGKMILIRQNILVAN